MEGTLHSRVLLLIILVAVLAFWGLATVVSGPLSDGPTPYPTDYPPVKQTLEVAEMQTREAARLTPPPPAGAKFIGSAPEVEQIEPQGASAGAGVITDEVGRPSVSGEAFGLHNAWYAATAGGYVIVYAGEDRVNPSQGAIIVVRSGPTSPTSVEWIDTPVQAGAVQIVDAVDWRLILLSSEGETFYFDVLGDCFLSSLTETVPTVTPQPTSIPAPTSTPPFSDDASDMPGFVLDNSPVDTDLHYTISPSGDEDWFRFRTDSTGTLIVSLTGLPACYHYHVYAVRHAELTGDASAVSLVALVNAPPDDYYVHVVAAEGACESDMPYVLRFETDLHDTYLPLVLTR